MEIVARKPVRAVPDDTHLCRPDGNAGCAASSNSPRPQGRCTVLIKIGQCAKRVSHVAIVRTAEDLCAIIPFLREAFDVALREAGPTLPNASNAGESACATMANHSLGRCQLFSYLGHTRA